MSEVIIQRRPLRYQAAAVLGTAGLLLAGAYEAKQKLTPHLPTIPKVAETKTQVGLSRVIAEELAKVKEFKGSKRTYDVTTSITKTRTLLGISGDRDTEYISTKGSAEGVIDLSGLNETKIYVSPDNTTVILTVPHAQVKNVESSHEAGVMVITSDRNNACKLDDCHLVKDRELIQLADSKVADAVSNDKEIVPGAESQARNFFDGLINGIGLPLLQHQDPARAPMHINVQLAFDNAAGPASFQPDVRSKG